MLTCTLHVHVYLHLHVVVNRHLQYIIHTYVQYVVDLICITVAEWTHPITFSLFESGHHDVAVMLISKGADINHVDKVSDTS